MIDFPKRVIARQTSQDTAEGRLLHFELDAEKYYQHLFPDAVYGEYTTYTGNPIYDVLLDGEGRIRQAAFRFGDQGGNEQSWYVMEHSCTTVFRQYGGVDFVFPPLRAEEYLDMDALRSEQQPAADSE